MSFIDEEIAYLRSQPLARVSTVSADGQPDVVPLSFEFDGTYFWIGGNGPAVRATRKFRNISGGSERVALVVDDMVSFDLTADLTALRTPGVDVRPPGLCGADARCVTSDRTAPWDASGARQLAATWHDLAGDE